MTRIRPRRLDRFRAMFAGIDKAFVDRGDPYDQTKIQQLEEKMNEKCFDEINNFNKINYEKLNKPLNKKMNLKNSKRF